LQRFFKQVSTKTFLKYFKPIAVPGAGATHVPGTRNTGGTGTSAISVVIAGGGGPAGPEVEAGIKNQH
jgi:hypothetical protein